MTDFELSAAGNSDKRYQNALAAARASGWLARLDQDVDGDPDRAYRYARRAAHAARRALALQAGETVGDDAIDFEPHDEHGRVKRVVPWESLPLEERPIEWFDFLAGIVPEERHLKDELLAKSWGRDALFEMGFGPLARSEVAFAFARAAAHYARLHLGVADER